MRLRRSSTAAARATGACSSSASARTARRVYLRRDADASAALQSLADAGCEIGVFTDAPEPLARVALAQLGAERRVSAVETGSGALERLLARLGDDAVVVRTREELVAYASTPAS